MAVCALNLDTWEGDTQADSMEPEGAQSGATVLGSVTTPNLATGHRQILPGGTGSAAPPTGISEQGWAAARLDTVGLLLPMESIVSGTWTLEAILQVVAVAATGSLSFRAWKVTVAAGDIDLATRIPLPGEDANGWVYSAAAAVATSALGGTQFTITVPSVVAISMNSASRPYLFIELGFNTTVSGVSTTVAMRDASLTVPSIAYARTATESVTATDSPARAFAGARTVQDNTSRQIRNNFDGGTDGVAITTGNSGGASGDAFNGVAGAPTFDNDHAHSGSLAAKFTGSGDRLDYTTLLGTQPRFLGRWWVYLETLPSTQFNFMRAFGGAGSSLNGRVGLTSGNKLFVGGGTAGNTVAGTVNFPTGEWVEVTLWLHTSGGFTDGIATFTGSSTSDSVRIRNQVDTAGDFRLYRFEPAAAVTWWLDDIAVGELLVPATDAVSRQAAYARALAESAPAASDAVARLFVGARTVSESIAAAADVVTRQTVVARQVSESVPASSDTVARMLAARRSIAESVPAATDAVTRAFAGARTVTEDVASLSSPADLANSFEGGVEDAVITAANSGGASGNAFDAAAISGSPTFDNAHSVGTRAGKFAVGASPGTSFVGWLPLETTTVFEVRARLWITAAPPVGKVLYPVRFDSPNTAGFQIYSDGKWGLGDNAGNRIAEGLVAFPLNQWVEVALYVVIHPSAGVLKATVNGEVVQATGRNTGTGVDNWLFGAIAAGGITNYTMWVDSIAVYVDPVYGASDAVSRSFVGSRGIAESIPEATDAVARIFGGVRAIAESVPAASDAVARTFQANREVTETIPAASDTVTRQTAVTRTVTETVPAATDAVSRILQATRTIEEETCPPGGGSTMVAPDLVIVRGRGPFVKVADGDPAFYE